MPFAKIVQDIALYTDGNNENERHDKTEGLNLLRCLDIRGAWRDLEEGKQGKGFSGENVAIFHLHLRQTRPRDRRIREERLVCLENFLNHTCSRKGNSENRVAIVNMIGI